MLSLVTRQVSRLDARLAGTPHSKSLTVTPWGLLVVELGRSEGCRCLRLAVPGAGLLQVSLPRNYPVASCPVVLLDGVCAGQTPSERQQTHAALMDMYTGQPCLFQWMDYLQAAVVGCQSTEAEVKDTSVAAKLAAVQLSAHAPRNEPSPCGAACAVTPCFDIYHGEAFTDRRSTFQAHVARVTSTEQVSLVQRQLLSNAKVCTATHNIMAYRIEYAAGRFLHDCDDDGEGGAGSRLLHLLQIADCVNCIVVVSRLVQFPFPSSALRSDRVESWQARPFLQRKKKVIMTFCNRLCQRWYGGIQLGPDRFKHINSAAR